MPQWSTGIPRRETPKKNPHKVVHGCKPQELPCVPLQNVFNSQNFIFSVHNLKAFVSTKEGRYENEDFQAYIGTNISCYRNTSHHRRYVQNINNRGIEEEECCLADSVQHKTVVLDTIEHVKLPVVPRLASGAAQVGICVVITEGVNDFHNHGVFTFGATIIGLRLDLTILRML